MTAKVINSPTHKATQTVYHHPYYHILEAPDSIPITSMVATTPDSLSDGQSGAGSIMNVTIMQSEASSVLQIPLYDNNGKPVHL